MLILYAACHVVCWLSSPLSALSSSVVLFWGPFTPAGLSAAALPAVWQSSEQCLRASTAAPSSLAPLSVPPPRPLCGSHPPNRVWRCPSSTGCVRMTASGLSGAFPSMTCPKRSIKNENTLLDRDADITNMNHTRCFCI